MSSNVNLMLWGINDLSSQPRLVKQRNDRNKLLFVLIQQAVFHREFQKQFGFPLLQSIKLQPLVGLNLESIVYTKVFKWNTDHLGKMNYRLQVVESTNVYRTCMPGFSAWYWAQSWAMNFIECWEREDQKH